MKIPLVDLQAQYRAIKSDIDSAIQRVLERGQFILGPEVEALERELAVYCGTRHAVAVASGTDALELSLRACGIGLGDEVITTALSFFATAEAIMAAGATPVFVDIDPATYTIDAHQAEAATTPRTKAILPVHLFGHPCDMDALQRVANTRHLALIEDCAQAIGATYRQRRVGSFGTAGCFSFYPSKNLGAYGDGGMVVTNDPALADRIRLLRTHGSLGGYHHTTIGTNSRLDELQAAMLRVKLPHLDAWNEARRRNAHQYAQLFSRYGLKDIHSPVERPDCVHVYHLYTIRARERERIQTALAQHGIATQVYYPLTLPRQPALVSLAKRFSACPHAEEATRTALSLPMYPELPVEAIEDVARQLFEVR